MKKITAKSRAVKNPPYPWMKPLAAFLLKLQEYAPEEADKEAKELIKSLNDSGAKTSARWVADLMGVPS